MPKIVDRFQDHQTGGVRASKFEDGRGQHVVDCAKDVGSMPSAGAGLVRSKVRIGTERPTAELTPARSSASSKR